jgi:hypothetical protein
MSEEELRYPVGRFRSPEGEVSAQQRDEWVEDVATLPTHLRAALAELGANRLDATYRPGGWTVRQVVHHLPDSHANAYIRFKLALTEEQPTIKPYAEDRWADLPDSRVTPVEVSLSLLDALHHRWVDLLRAMQPAEFARTLLHPQQGRVLTLDQMLALYSWHGRHHLAHVAGVRG